jgi:NADPH-dependent 2,4-dienoyl-CoA reductase/sulfur reductase-like enzyme
MTGATQAGGRVDGGRTADRDVVVVGGGPAGLTAALHLAAAGMSVTLVDEQPELGGQYYRRPSPAVLSQRGDHRPEGGRLIAAVRAAGVDCRTGTSVWGLADDGRTLLTCASDGAGRADALSGRYLVIATGAYERVLPFPGWELPGVTTAGFAQHLASADGTAVGTRVVLAGSGPFLLPVACSLLELGVTVAGIVEAGQPYRLSATGALTALRFPGRLGELARYAARLARHGVPVWQARIVARADPDETGQHVGSVTLAAAHAPAVPLTRIHIDALCVGTGFRPQTELAQLLGCAMEPDPDSGDLLPVISAGGRSSRPDVFIAGEAGGIGGARQAAAEGEAAAAAILATEGLPPAGIRPRGGPGTGRRVRRQRRFAALTGRLYPRPGELAAALAQALPDEVRVCRCEAVTAGQVRAAAAAAGPAPGGTADQGVVRGLSRAGMGPCQGRECAATVRALCGPGPAGTGPAGTGSAGTGSAGTGSAGTGLARMPVRPVSLLLAASLADLPDLAAHGQGPALPAPPAAPGTVPA